ncbi:hypothetical protein M9Y10_008281 [Tritrichomonas musculus]|uniref:TNase-like domain-containing protein n=1 Tax=Tritrichomonas musculus TaxID=1915356 RepID=A0ABR2IY03_9EUKA
MSTNDNSRAYVLSALTGDTLLVRYCDQPHKYGVILLPVACAPQFSIFLNSAVNDPFAVESLNFLRDHIEHKRILIGPPSQSYNGPKVFTHQTLGPLPVSVNSVRLIDDPNEDIDAYLIQNGFACIRENAPLNNKAWLARYEQLQESAYVNKVGIWSESRSTTINPQVVNQFEATIISLNSDFTFKLLDPGIDVELAGVTEINSKRSSELLKNFKIFLGERVLFHKALIRILQRLPGVPPVVSISINNFDLAHVLLENNYAAINEITSHLLENEKEIRRNLQLNTKCEHEFTAKVIKILSSNSFLIDDYKTIILSHIIVPRFDFTRETEKYGIEAFRFLRDKILYQRVTINVFVDNVGEVYSVVKVGHQNINLLMIKEGLATIAKSRIQGNPPFYDEMKKELDRAIELKIGIHSKQNSYSSNKIGIVDEITSPTKIKIFIDNDSKIFDLQNLTTTDYSYFNIVKAIDILKSKYLQHDVEIRSDGSIVDIKSNEDLRVPLLKEGLAILSKNLSDQTLISAEKEAKSKQIGLHSNLTTKLNFNDPVVITNIIKPTMFVVQSQSEMMAQLHNDFVQNSFQEIERPNIGEIYIVRINGKIYRCKILNDQTYFLIDFGFVFPIKIGKLSVCPNNISKIPPQAFCVSLNGCLTFDNKEHESQAMKFLWNVFDQKNIYNINLISQKENGLIPEVVIYDIPTKNNINAALLKCGIIRINSSSKINDTELIKAETEAKNAKTGGWSLNQK